MGEFFWSNEEKIFCKEGVYISRWNECDERLWHNMFDFVWERNLLL
jgi:hypothetical protein